jgi:hypothetical protein
VFEYGTLEANISEIRINPDFNKDYPSYALFHSLSEFYLKERGFDYISDGYRSLAHNTGIQHLLETKFGFVKQPLALELVIKFPYNILARCFAFMAGKTPLVSVNALLTLTNIKKAGNYPAK